MWMDRFKILFFGLLFSATALAADYVSDSEYFDRLPLLEFTKSFLVVHNTDNSVRGGIYEVLPGTSIYLSNLHTLQRSTFMDLNREAFYFYGFKQPVNARLEEYRWLDIVLVIEKMKYPGGYMDPRVQAVLGVLSSRSYVVGSEALAVNGIVPDSKFNDIYFIKSNKGRIGENRNGIVFEAPLSTSTITGGSSGTMVFAQTKDRFLNAGLPQYAHNIPIGILKCRDLRFSVMDGYVRYEIQTFNFLLDSNLLFEELRTPPPVMFSPHCLNINARTHGGM